MDKMMDSPLILRIIALGLAVLLFFSVRADFNSKNNGSAVNEQVDVLRDVPLEVYYDQDNLLVTGMPATVDVKIKGPMPIVLQAKAAKDYKVFVDLNRLAIGKHHVKLQHENFSDKLEVSIDPASIDVSIEERITREFRVEPEMNKRMIDEGYILTGMEVEPNKVFVTGPKSAIDNISYVKATLSGKDTIMDSFTEEAEVRVLDKDLNKLDVIVEPAKVKVDVKIKQYNRDVPIKLKTTGKLPDGLVLGEMVAEQQYVTVFGAKSMVDALGELDVLVDLSKVKESKQYEFAVVAPEGVKKLSADKVKVKVTVTKQDAETPVTEDETNKQEPDKPAVDEPTEQKPIEEPADKDKEKDTEKDKNKTEEAQRPPKVPEVEEEDSDNQNDVT